MLPARAPAHTICCSSTSTDHELKLEMFRIKICGITNVEDALVVARAGADAVGLNFYKKSPRYVDFDRAREIVDALSKPIVESSQLAGLSAPAQEIATAMPPLIAKVGVFVNAPAEEICRAFDQLRLDLIQLHGDEPPEFLTELGGLLKPQDRLLPLIRAFRLGSDGLRPVEDYLAGCVLDLRPRMVLLDSLVEGKYGGSGQTADWSLAAEYAGGASSTPLVLAGGLTPQNVAEAIREVRPKAVDTASGVESSSGKKDPVAVKAFVRAAREAFAKQRP